MAAKQTPPSKEALIVFNPEDLPSFSYVWHDREEEWLEIENKLEDDDVSGFPVALEGSRVVLLDSGQGIGYTSEQCWTGAWQALHCSFEHRASTGIVHEAGSIYVIGGTRPEDDETAVSNVDRYSLADKSWERSADLPNAVMSPAVFAHEQRVFVLGGCCRIVPLQTSRHLQVLDVQHDKWTVVPDVLPEESEGVSAVFFGHDRAFVTLKDAVAVLDLHDLKLSLVAHLDDDFSYGSMTVHASKIVVVRQNKVRIVDPDSFAVTCIKDLPCDPSWTACISLPMPLNAYNELESPREEMDDE